MNISKMIRNYAYGAFLYAKDHDCVFEWRLMFKQSVNTLSDPIQMHNFSKCSRDHLYSKDMAQNFSKEFQRFVYLIEEDNILKYILKIYAIFSKLLYINKYCFDAKIETTIEVDYNLQMKIINRLKQKYQMQQVFLETTVNKNIIGGIVLYTFDGIINCSIKYKFKSIQS